MKVLENSLLTRAIEKACDSPAMSQDSTANRRVGFSFGKA